MLCLIFAYIPFIVADGITFPSNLFFPYITGKNFTFRILVEIAFGLYILLALREPKFRPKASLLMWSVVGLMVWVGLATILSVDPVKSFWSNFERMEGYLGLLHLAALFVVAGAVVTAEGWWDRLFKISIAASALQGLHAFFQLMGWAAISTQSGSRVDTTFGNATYLAVYLLFNIFLTLYMLTKERRSRFMQSVYGIVLVFQVVALFNTQTRGAILGFIGGLIIMGLYIIWKGSGPNYKALRKWAIGGIATLAVLAGVLYGLRDTSFVQNVPVLNRLASISLSETTVMSRFNHIWPIAFKGFAEKPIIGWGQENFSYVFNAHYPPEMYNQEQWFDRAHNQFLDWLLAAGIPAFLLFISLFLFGAWAVYRSNLEVSSQAALLGLLGAYAFHSMFVFDNIGSAMYFFLILAFLHSLFPARVPRFMALSRPVGDHGVAIAAPIVAVLLISSIYYFNVPGMSRARTIIDAITPARQVVQNGAVVQQQKDPKENLASFEKALSQGELGKQEVVEQLYQFAGGILSSPSVSPEIKTQVYEMTRREGEELLAERPGDARLELFFAMFLNQAALHQEARDHFDVALALSPTKQQILFQSALTSLAINDTDAALRDFKKAYDLAPEFAEARMYYAMGLYSAGRAAEGDALLVEKYGTVLVDNERLLQLYNSLKMHSRVIGILESRVAKSPENADLRVNLAAGYFAAGDKARTIVELRKAAEINPSMAVQIEQLIKQINDGTLKPGQ